MREIDASARTIHTELGLGRRGFRTRPKPVPPLRGLGWNFDSTQHSACDSVRGQPMRRSRR